MGSKSFLSMLIASIFILPAPLTTFSQDSADTSDRAPSDGRESSASKDLGKSEIVGLQQAIGRLETKIDRLLAHPSEFTDVEVKVVDEGGKPTSGYKVQLSSVGDVQFAKATGVSDDDGIGLTRALPYGRYRMNVSGNGWFTHDLVTLEVGQPLELTVVVPSSDRTGELVLQAAIVPSSVIGLPFGYWERKAENGWGRRVAPERGGYRENTDDWKTFPTVSDGIEGVAVVVGIDIKRRIDQPETHPLTWQWQGASSGKDEPHLKWLVQSNGTIRPLLKMHQRSSQISSQAEWFQAIAIAPTPKAEEDERNLSLRPERLGYQILELGGENNREAAIELPSGQYELYVETIYGAPKEDVLRAIDQESDVHEGEVWLPSAASSMSAEWMLGLIGYSWDKSRQRLTMSLDVTTNRREVVKIGTGNPTASDAIAQ